MCSNLLCRQQEAIIFFFAVRCNGLPECVDQSDEFGSCEEDEYTCDCVIKKSCIKCNGCINKTLARTNGFIDCPEERRIPFGSHGKISIYKLNNTLECNEIGFPECDNSTCFPFNVFASNNSEHAATSYQTCTSVCSDQQYCQKNRTFQCSDNSYIFLDVFCDGVNDCADGSDEIVNKPGFKCNKCVLPQNNLYDDLAQCDDKSDLCKFRNNSTCFLCLDNRLLISSKQVCDGVNDCYDLSDECLCDDKIDDAKECVDLFKAKNSSCLENKTLHSTHSKLQIYIHSIQFGKKSKTCSTKYGFVQALPCDGRPECKDYSDECQCNNPPAFCNDPCHSFFPMGDRYCDGAEDPAWNYLNKSVCPKGFDELECPKRFKCNATGNVSIDIKQKCDGKPDCDDRSDENNCAMKQNQPIFSSDTEMIASPAIKAAFWIMGFVVLFSNAYVVAKTTQFLKMQKVFNFAVFQHVVILNIAIACIFDHHCCL